MFRRASGPWLPVPCQWWPRAARLGQSTDSEPEVAGEPDETPLPRRRGPRLQPIQEPIFESKPRESKPALSLAPVAEEATDDGEGESDSSPLQSPDGDETALDEPDSGGDDPEPRDPKPRHLRLIKS